MSAENNTIEENETEKIFNDEIIEKLNQLHENVLKTNKVTITDLRNVYEKFLELEKSSKISDSPIDIAKAAVSALNKTTTTTTSNRSRTTNHRNRNHRPSTVNITNSGRTNLIFSVCFLIFIMILTPIVYEVIQFLLGVRCFVPNNYLVWEATRPISDCSYCRNIRAPLILKNLTRDEFEPYAYSSRPIIIKNAVLHWPAIKILNFTYLKNLYETISGALDEDCQFLHFRSDFMSLRDVFNMPDERIRNLNGQKPWYVGWSNCHPVVLNELRKLYPRPHFLPEDAEMPNTDYIFLGYEQGAIMHLDYIPRLMWQAQLQGNKSWYLAPAPECDNECDSFSFYVEPGDAVLVDTRIWYHGTSIPKGQFALTIQSEYG